MIDKGVCVTGVGMLTPAGDGWAATWERVCKGLPTATLEGEQEPVYLACRVPGFDAKRLGQARARKPDRCAQLALLAARDALDDAGLDPSRLDGARVAVIVGTSASGAQTYEAQYRALLETGPQDVSPFAVPSSLSNSVAAQLAIEFRAAGPSFIVNTACASGATAIGMALDLLALDRCDIAIAGGADAPITPFFVAGYDRIHALSHRYDAPSGALRPFDTHRDGFVIGEGAGMMILERPSDARARKARTRARIVGYGATSDAYHVVKPHPHGTGLAAAIRTALATAAATPPEVSHVNAHGSGTQLGDLIEATALSRLFPQRPTVTSTKAVTGHLMGAAGAIEAALTVLTVEHHLIPPTANLTTLAPDIDLAIPTQCQLGPLNLALSTSMGFGGHNTVLAIAPA
jgi:3-oxoacyl-[acyl-carrier-protein] synthase II